MDSSAPLAADELLLRVERLEAEVGQARTREDLLRLQHEDTLSKASAAMAFQVEIAEQQRLVIEQLQEREKDLERQYRELRQEADQLREELAIREAERTGWEEQERKLSSKLTLAEQSLAATAQKLRGLDSRLPESWASLPEASALLQNELATEAEALEALRERIYYLSAEVGGGAAGGSVLESLARDWLDALEDFVSRISPSEKDAVDSPTEGRALSRHRMTIGLLESRVYHLEAELDQARKTLALAEEKGGKAKVFSQAIASLREKNGALEAKLQEANARLSDLHRLEVAHQQLQNALTDSQARLSEIEAELEQARAALEGEKKTRGNWESRVQELESQLKGAESLRSKAELLEIEIHRLTQQLALSAASEVSLRQEIESLREHALREAGAASQEIEAQRRRIQEFEAEMPLLRQHVEEANRRVLELETQLAQARESIHSYHQIEAAFREAQDQEIRLRSELDSAREARSAALGELESLRKQLVSAQARLDELTQSQAEILRRQDGWKSVESDLRASLAAIETGELRLLREEVARRATELESTQKESQSLRERLSQSDEQLQALEKELQSQKVALAKATARNAELEKALEQAAASHTSSIREWEAKAARQEEELLALRASEKALREKLTEPGEATDETERLLRELDIHREALASALEENRALVRKLRQIPGASRFRRLAFPGAVLVAAGVAAGALWLAWPKAGWDAENEAESLRITELETKNAFLAAQLDTALEQLREEAAKKPSRAFESSLLEPPAFDTSSAVALARITQLQSDLDLAQMRMQRLLSELSARDLRIMELETLLAEAEGRAFQIQMPPPLTDWEAPLPVTLTTFPDLLEVPSASPTELNEDPMRAVQRRAEEAYKARNFDMAETLFKTVAGSEPKNALALSNLAAVQLELGRFKEAESNIRQAIALKPEDAYALTTLGIIQIKRGEPQAAIETLLKSVALNSTDAEAFNYLGVAYGEAGLRQKAIEEIRKAIALSPNYTEARFNLAVLLARGTREEKAQARREYQHALALGADPDPLLDRLLD